MKYNHKNERTAKYVNGDFRLYMYDEASHLVGEYTVTKQVVWTWDPDAFGVFQPTLARVEVNLRFPGQYYVKHTGLYYNHNRYYNPQIGRYLEPDPERG